VIFYPRERKMTSRTAAALIVLIWTTPAVIFIPWLLVYDEQSFAVGQFEFVACHADWPLPELDRVFTLGVVFFTCYLMPLTFIGVFYVLIGVKVRHTQLHFNVNFEDLHSPDQMESAA